MKHLKKIVAYTFVLIIASSSTLFAQSKKEQKQQAKEKEAFEYALKDRLQADSRYAAGKRAAFNRSSWIGSKLADLIQQWGPPSRVVEDGAGGKIAVYNSSRTSSGGSYTPGTITTATNGVGQTVLLGSTAASDTRWSSTYSQSTAVYANKDGIITKVTHDSDYQSNY